MIVTGMRRNTAMSAGVKIAVCVALLSLLYAMDSEARAIEFHLSALDDISSIPSPIEMEHARLAYIRRNLDRLGVGYHEAAALPSLYRSITVRSMYVELPSGSDRTIVLATALHAQNHTNLALVLHILEYIAIARAPMRLYILFLGGEYINGDYNGYGLEEFLRTHGHLTGEALVYFNIANGSDGSREMLLDIGNSDHLTPFWLVHDAVNTERSRDLTIHIPTFWRTALRNNTLSGTAYQRVPTTPVSFLLAEGITALGIGSTSPASDRDAVFLDSSRLPHQSISQNGRLEYGALYDYASYIYALIDTIFIAGEQTAQRSTDTNYILFPFAGRYITMSETAIVGIILLILAAIYTLAVFRREYIKTIYWEIVRAHIPQVIAHAILLLGSAVGAAYLFRFYARIESVDALWNRYPSLLTLFRLLLWYWIYTASSWALIRIFKRRLERAYSVYALISSCLALFFVITFDLFFAILTLLITLGAFGFIVSANKARKGILYFGGVGAAAILFVYISTQSDVGFHERIVSTALADNIFLSLLILPPLFIHLRLLGLGVRLFSSKKWAISVGTVTTLLFFGGLFYHEIRDILFAGGIV